MISRLLPAPRLNVDHAVGDAHGQRLRTPGIVDAHSHVALEHVHAIVPPGKLLLTVEFPEQVDETPPAQILERLTLFLHEADGVLHLLGSPDVLGIPGPVSYTHLTLTTNR